MNELLSADMLLYDRPSSHMKTKFARQTGHLPRDKILVGVAQFTCDLRKKKAVRQVIHTLGEKKKNAESRKTRKNKKQKHR